MVKIRLAVLLAEKRWTQAQLARKTGIRPNTIGAIYNEYAEHISLHQITAICDALGCTLAELMEYTPKNK